MTGRGAAPWTLGLFYCVPLAALVAGCGELLATSPEVAEAGVPDAGAEAGTEAGTEAGGTLCTPPYVVCETFDVHSDGPLGGFEKDDDEPDTSIGPDDVLAFSAPRSARFEIRPSAASSLDAMLTFRNVNVPLRRFVFEGKIHIERAESAPGQFLRLGNEIDGQVILTTESVVVHDAVGSTTKAATVPIGTWVTIRAEVRPPDVMVTIADNPIPVPSSITWTEAPLRVFFGISETTSPTQGWVVRWDDIVVRALD